MTASKGLILHRYWLVPVALLSLFSLFGCSEEKMPEQSTLAVIEKLTKFTHQGPFGATMRLDAATDFSWDQVFFFQNPTIEDINDAVGQSVHLDDRVIGSLMSGAALLLFVEGDEIVDIIVVAPPLYLSGTSRRGYSTEEAVLLIHTKDPGPYVSLRFKE